MFFRCNSEKITIFPSLFISQAKIYWPVYLTTAVSNQKMSYGINLNCAPCVDEPNVFSFANIFKMRGIKSSIFCDFPIHCLCKRFPCALKNTCASHLFCPKDLFLCCNFFGCYVAICEDNIQIFQTSFVQRLLK